MPDTLDADLPADTANLPIFSVACDRTVFFRQGAFDYYDGHCWHISSGVVQIELIRGTRGTFSLRDIPAVTKTDVVPAIRLTQKFHVLENLGGKIIVAGNPSEISYPGPAITVDTCNNLTAAWFLVPGLEYSVYSDEPMYDLEAMRSEGIPSEAEESKLRSRLAVFRQIPDNQPERLYDLSQEIAGLSDNWFVQAEKICSYLRHEYKYSNDPKYKTAAINSSDRFLFDTRTGDCKDFATAFVLMCRASGIPARLVMGFSAGDFDPATGTRLVKLKNSHTWGEIYFPSTGWVPFDPTPQGILPAKQKEKERYFTTIGQNFENSIRTAKVAENLGQQATAPQMQIRLPDGSIFTIAIDFWQLWKCLPLLFVALVVYAPLAELIKSLAKNICWPKARHPASKCYAQVLKDLKVLGINSPDSQTPGEFLAQVKEKLAGGDDPDRSRRLAQAVEEFISCYNATFYGAQGPASELEKKQLKVHELIKS